VTTDSSAGDSSSECRCWTAATNRPSGHRGEIGEGRVGNGWNTGEWGPLVCFLHGSRVGSPG
jgi:hypothetical protein